MVTCWNYCIFFLKKKKKGTHNVSHPTKLQKVSKNEIPVNIKMFYSGLVLIQMNNDKKKEPQFFMFKKVYGEWF